MAAQKGKDLLLKVDSTGAGVYTTVAGLRSRTFAVNADPSISRTAKAQADGANCCRELARNRRA